MAKFKMKLFTIVKAKVKAKITAATKVTITSSTGALKKVGEVVKLNLNQAKINRMRINKAKASGQWKGMMGNIKDQRKANLARRTEMKTLRQEAASQGQSLWKYNIERARKVNRANTLSAQRARNVKRWQSKKTLKAKVGKQAKTIARLEKQIATLKNKSLIGKQSVYKTILPKNPIARQKQVMYNMRTRQQAIVAFKAEVDEVLRGASSARLTVPGTVWNPELILDKHLSGELSLGDIQNMTKSYDKFLEKMGINDARAFLDHDISAAEADAIIDRIAFDTHMNNWRDGFMSGTGPDAKWETLHGDKDKVWDKIEFEERSRFERAGGNFKAFKQLRAAEKANEALKRNR